MSTIQNIAAPSANTTSQRTQLNQDFDDFLLLLTTQLQNQDPLEPMDTKDFTNQLVQFSQVEQQLKTNDVLEDLRALDVLRITELGLSFVGMDVEMAGNTFSFDGEGEISLGYILPDDAKETTISIKNADGDVVYKSDGEITAGIKAFKWDGKNQDGYTVPEGTYTIEVSALDKAGESLKVQTSVPGRVSGIESDGAGNVLLLIGDMKVPITDVTRAKLPKGISDVSPDTETPDTETGENDNNTEDPPTTES